MKTKTIKGTNVEIVGLTGCNMVTVTVSGQDSIAQVDAADLIRPKGDLPEELSELKFYDPSKEPPKVPEDQSEDEDEKSPKNID